MENCSHARRFLLYSDVVVILKSTVGLAGCTGTPVMQRNDFQSSSSFDKNRESRSENSMSLQIGIILERILKGEMGTNSLSLLSSGFYTKTSLRAGYSTGGETMSQAVPMRPDLYAAYLHGASQWDGKYAPIAENGVAVYVFMAENDEYCGSQRARDACENLRGAYIDAGWNENEIDDIL